MERTAEMHTLIAKLRIKLESILLNEKKKSVENKNAMQTLNFLDIGIIFNGNK